jgi:nucleoside-diphosphate-sugar epimerase
VKRARQRGYAVVSLSRRGKLQDETDDSVSWVAGDAAQEKVVRAVIEDFGPFDACIHAVGLLLDAESGLSPLNKFASGSGSRPTLESTYDRITRQTAMTAIDCISANGSDAAQKPFVFVSAAEAGWTLPAPIGWLEKYLVAKRAVEKKLLESAVVGIRPVILRPSLIWTPRRPQALVSVLPFYVGHAIKLPFVDKPVRLEVLAETALRAVEDSSIRGILRFDSMQRIAGDAR